MKSATLGVSALIVAVLVSGCAPDMAFSSRRTIYGHQWTGERIPNLPAADEMEARYSMRTHGVRFVSGRAGVRLYNWLYLPHAYLDMEMYRRPRVTRGAYWFRIADKQEDLGRLDLPAEAPN